jgi:hypothetical protein
MKQQGWEYRLIRLKGNAVGIWIWAYWCFTTTSADQASRHTRGLRGCAYASLERFDALHSLTFPDQPLQEISVDHPLQIIMSRQHPWPTAKCVQLSVKSYPNFVNRHQCFPARKRCCVTAEQFTIMLSCYLQHYYPYHRLLYELETAETYAARCTCSEVFDI